MHLSRISLVLLHLILTLSSCRKNADNVGKGIELYKAKDYSSANMQFNRAISRGVNSEEALFYKAMCLIELDSLDKSAYLLSILYQKSNIDKGKILYNLGHIYNEKGNYDKAFDYFYAALVLGYDIKLLNTNIGITLLNSEKCKSAISYLSKDYYVDKPSKITLLALSDAYSCIGMADSASYFKTSAKNLQP